jgi:hypothetical protein
MIGILAVLNVRYAAVALVCWATHLLAESHMTAFHRLAAVS